MSRLSRSLRPRSPSPPEPERPPLVVFAPPATPYEHLLTVPRYQVRTERLLGHDFRIADGASFYASYREIFQNEIYRFRAASRAPVIVDCGANCGVSVAYFKQLYPEAVVTAVEADPRIFEMLQWNVRRQGHGDVRLINRAVVHGASEVAFHREGADAGRIHPLADAKGQITVPAISLDELLADPVDFLKLDVEGAETDLLCASNRLNQVSQLFVEYHSFADADQSLHLMLAKLADCGFRYYVQTQFCGPQPLVAQPCHLGMDLQLNIFAMRTSTPTN